MAPELIFHGKNSGSDPEIAWIECTDDSNMDMPLQTTYSGTHATAVLDLSQLK